MNNNSDLYKNQPNQQSRRRSSALMNDDFDNTNGPTSPLPNLSKAKNPQSVLDSENFKSANRMLVAKNQSSDDEFDNIGKDEDVHNSIRNMKPLPLNSEKRFSVQVGTTTNRLNKEQDLTDHGPKLTENYEVLNQFPELDSNTLEIKKNIESTRQYFQYKPEIKEFQNYPYFQIRFKDSESSGVYWGQMWNHQKRGKGKILYNNGNFYEGYWKNDLPNISGREYCMNDKYQYFDGHYLDGLKHGAGYMVFNNGDSYEGPFNKGQPQGIGTKKMFLLDKVKDIDAKELPHDRYEGIGRDN